MEGEFPDKCFHAVGDGTIWPRAQPTTGRGKFYVDPVALSELQSGIICLLMKVREFSTSFEPEYTGYQTWDDKQWSSLGKEPPTEALQALAAHAISDNWGNTVTSEEQGGECRSVVRNRERIVSRGPLLLSKPLMARDHAGRVVVLSQDAPHGELQLWSGAEWSEPVAFELDRGAKVTHLLPNPGGDIYLVCEGGSDIQIQRVQSTVQRR